MQDVEQVALEFLRRAAEEEHVHLQMLQRYDSKPADKTTSKSTCQANLTCGKEWRRGRGGVGAGQMSL